MNQTVQSHDGTRPVLEVRHVTKSFRGAAALTDANIVVRRGEIHAIVGENGAGKSTLMNIIAGVMTPDSGEILYNGRPAAFGSPAEATRAGVGIVHQELSLCPDISVAENIFLDSPPTNRLGMLSFKKMHAEAASLLDVFHATASPGDRLGDLTVAEQQVVEIARTVRHESQLIIFDEPTSSLTDAESAALYGLIRRLRDQGISCIYISHRMSEVFGLCDTITVMRDGRWVSTSPTASVTPDQVVTQMVGRPISQLYPEKTGESGEPVLRVESAARARAFQGISFTAHRGEILGFSGLVGSGRTELMKSIVGIDQLDAGKVFLEGRELTRYSYADAVKQGLCYMTEDRKLEGLFLERSVNENINAAVLPAISRGGMVRSAQARENSERYVASLNIRCRDIDQEVGRLSGGNQQKTMLAKWLLVNPRVLILDEPTRGIDVGAKHEIHRLLRDLADRGICVVIVSSDVPEIIGLCDRVLVLSEGRLAGELAAPDIAEDAIVRLASITTAA